MSDNLPTIFVSYAHVDNKPTSGEEEEGWVSHFVNDLCQEITRQFGRAEYYKLWMDSKLKTGDAITPEIEKQLGITDILVIFLSPGWRSSKSCQHELKFFCKQFSEEALQGRIFVVDQGGLSSEEMPEKFLDLKRIPFFEQTENERVKKLGYPFIQRNSERIKYYNRVMELSEDLTEALKKFGNGSNHTSESNESGEKKIDCPGVYIAPVPDRLYDQRRFLVSELNQFGISVLPEVNSVEQDIEANLKKCSFFVQLLDEDYMMGLPRKYMETAQRHNLTVLQWCDPSLDTRSIVRPVQRKLLEGATVRACELSDFSRQVRDALLPPEVSGDEEPVVDKESEDTTVFVLASQEDFDCAYEVRRILKSRGWGTILPRYTGEPASVRKNIENGYKYCDVLLVMHQQASAELVDDYIKGALIHAPNEIKILVCQREGADELHFEPSGVQTLICNSHFKDDCLKQFLGEVSK